MRLTVGYHLYIPCILLLFMFGLWEGGLVLVRRWEVETVMTAMTQNAMVFYIIHHEYVHCIVIACSIVT